MNLTAISIITLSIFCTLNAESHPLQTDSESPSDKKTQEVSLEKDIVYATINGKNLLLDIITPLGQSEERKPVIVWIHGGAWLAGNKDHNYASFLSQHGYITVSINYRLSQEAIWPAQIHDCKAAIRFLRAHAQQYQIDPDRIGVWGDSAGGHLVAMLGTSGDRK